MRKRRKRERRRRNVLAHVIDRYWHRSSFQDNWIHISEISPGPSFHPPLRCLICGVSSSIRCPPPGGKMAAAAPHYLLSGESQKRINMHLF